MKISQTNWVNAQSSVRHRGRSARAPATIPRYGFEIFGILMFAAAMTIRPSLLGQDLTPFGSALAFACGLGVLWLGGCELKLLKLTVLSQGSAILLWMVLAAHSILSGVTLSFAFTAFITILLTSTGALLGFSNRRFHDAFFGALRTYLALCGLSLIVTVTISLVVGLHSLYFVTLASRGYNIVGYSDVYFPFTVSYGYREIFGHIVPRGGAGFRESGIAQAFFAFAIMSIPELRHPRQWLMLALLVVGGFGTLSTTGLAIVGIATSLRVLMLEGIGARTRIAILLVVALFGWYTVAIALNDETVGFAAKIDTMSYLDRKNQTSAGIEYFLEHPMGAGVYAPQLSAGINLLASLGSIGILGLIGILANVILSCFGAVNRVRKALAILPLFLTALTSQPLLDAGFVYLCYGFLALDPRAVIPSATKQAALRQTAGRARI